MPPLIRLLRAVRDDVQDLTLATFDDAEIRWLLNIGFGPLLHRVTGGEQSNSRPDWRQSVLSADLTAKVLTRDLTDAMSDIIDVTRNTDAQLTLLKGISICGQHYPAEHLRLMGDIDILVDKQCYFDVEAALLDLGYRRHTHRRTGTWSGHHHGPPLFDPKRKVWVEIHTDLFPNDSQIKTATVFSQPSVQAERVAYRFHDRDVWRITDELQLVYIASYWPRDLSYGFSRIGLATPLPDLVFLLRNSRHAFDWDRVLGWLNHELLAGCLYVVLSYLDKHDLADLPPEVIIEVERRQHMVNRTNLALLHRLINNYVASNKKFNRVITAKNTTIVWDTLLTSRRAWQNIALVPWHLVFPRRDPERFTMAYQIGRLKTMISSRS